jgi:hypothetical protein
MKMLIRSKYKPRNVILTPHASGAVQVSCLVTGKTITVIGKSDYQEKEIERIDRARASFIRKYQQDNNIRIVE